MRRLLLFFFACTFAFTAAGQDFFYGNDLSYANQMEDCGAVFKEAGVPKDVYQIFADQGTNLVRVRLWVDPTWQNSLEQPAGVKLQYSDFEDVKETIRRAKAAGMKVMLGLHYSDIWADPGRQLIPARWLDRANDTEALSQAVYDYTVEVLQTLNAEGLMPDIVKVGNETNGGILYHTSTNANHEATGSVSANWTRHAALFNAGIRAVRAVGATATINPKIALHYSGLNNLKAWYQNAINYGVTDFDIIGFSYYYSWHGGSIGALGQTVQDMVTSFPAYQVAVVETGYLWTTENFDTSGNIIDTPDPAYLPVSPEKQLEYMVDFTRQVKASGGSGVIFWEPAWVSTPCRTPWGQGSSHDHVAFFDPVNNNFIENGGGRWTNASFYAPQPDKQVTFKVDMTGADASKGVFVTGDFDGPNWQIRPMTHLGNNIYSWSTTLPATAAGGYYFLNGPDWANRETVPAACATMWNKDRGYNVAQSTEFAFKWASCDPIVPATVPITFKVSMQNSGVNTANGVYLVGEVNDWTFTPMTHEGNQIYSTTLSLKPGESKAYYYITNNSWDNYMQYRETVPTACAESNGVDRLLRVPNAAATVGFKWSSCEAIGATLTASPAKKKAIGAGAASVYPNPTSGQVMISLPTHSKGLKVVVLNTAGQQVFLRDHLRTDASGQLSVGLTDLPAGLFLIRVFSEGRSIVNQRLVIQK
ncbi:glycosyl hydrolase 53 family protein [Pontibacter sp. E15-1]|uniref:glycosyl hydrolase 53 family protein n=1 Tax=Pontibacter sp. E15-1 TaxID=2919918 RepID=UPI001F4FD19F|nr:glycosyl hydrolase 53 family protein [Pontibacter sp. E15-1]MCJ8163937.1 glycosyl hydrolase 53 family protein [Pontibacter sp. E15-1]